jgi:hypothetical protein
VSVLDAFFPPDGHIDVGTLLEIYQHMNTVAFGKPIQEVIAMLVHSADQSLVTPV